jgi:hypothetical protein
VQRAIILITASQRLTSEYADAEEAQIAERKFRALDYLSQAEKLLKRDDLPSNSLHVRLGYIAALAPLDSPRALEAFGDIVVAINKTDSFDIPATSAPRIVGLDGSDMQLSLPRIRSGYGLKDAVRLLAHADLEGVVSVAGKLSEPSVRGTCLFQIAQSVLSTDSKE